MDKLIFQTSPSGTFTTNVVQNVPVILQYDDAALVSVVRDEGLGFTTSIPVYHSDGTYLAKVDGIRIFPTEDGMKAGLEMRFPKGEIGVPPGNHSPGLTAICRLA